MANMNHCQACRRPYFLHEAACPFCGVQAPGGRVGRYVRRAKVGGLMLFTALTTAACYGAPPPPGTFPKSPRTAIEQPLAKMPTTVGTAYLFVTPKGTTKAGSTLKLEAATLEGTALAFKGTPGSTGQALPSGDFSLAIEALEASAFQAPGKDEAFQPLPVEKMKALAVSAPYTDGKGRKAILEVKPGATGVQGTLQLSRLDDDAVGGVLRLDYADTTVELYFLAAR